ncbi:hypothetical protein BU14_0130s0005 [Porphyra umbilicalis]|uniref:Uncharacterized protein n=1 Tax=Porphyra umbilicalis TaxID=2786 RepID=A0A1X6PAD6_PORUM|nr:hypothetical protein BU14_0130s0005 [Porphyra umbilicalis]|eukprot:OSX77851.1 hypothetical protein BU14_0130s0005 [Porphyra umbilicalis]
MVLGARAPVAAAFATTPHQTLVFVPTEGAGTPSSPRRPPVARLSYCLWQLRGANGVRETQETRRLSTTWSGTGGFRLQDIKKKADPHPPPHSRSTDGRLSPSFRLIDGRLPRSMDGRLPPPPPSPTLYPGSPPRTHPHPPLPRLPRRRGPCPGCPRPPVARPPRLAAAPGPPPPRPRRRKPHSRCEGGFPRRVCRPHLPSPRPRSPTAAARPPLRR